MKKVLVLCTGNSCRSIMAEALINAELSEKGIRAFSAGSRPQGRVNPNAERVLKERAIWRDEYHSKAIEELDDEAPFDLLVTVCDKARESCPLYEKAAESLHIPYRDPDGMGYEAFQSTLQKMRKSLLPAVEECLSD